MSVTIKDVAKEAGVATSTVSRVLANSNKISEETKERVNEAVKKLNYTPNVIARGLANNKTRILAVVLTEIAENLFENPFYIKAMKGISICAEKENYYIMYAFKEEGEKDREWLKKFTSSNIVDGICLLNVKEEDECINFLQKINYNFVVIGRPDDEKNILWVDNDNVKAMKELTKKIITNGHTDIAYIGAKKELNVSKDRLKGYKEALKEENIKEEKALIFQGKEFSEKVGYEGILKILKKRKATAIVFTDDLLAFGAQNALKENNIENICIASFNNTPLAKYQNPPLASIDINPEKLGFSAIKILIDKLEKREGAKKHCIIETELIERESLK